MAYRFQGFFVAMDDEAVTATLFQAVPTLWAEAICRRISSPFVGVGVSRTADALDAGTSSDQFFSEPVGPWTRRFPALTFVQIEALCFGGTCDYEGAVWRDGQELWREERDQPGNDPLIRLLKHLGVTSDDGYFEPFTRGYFTAES